MSFSHGNTEVWRHGWWRRQFFIFADSSTDSDGGGSSFRNLGIEDMTRSARCVSG
jgi:hypothetical protein